MTEIAAGGEDRQTLLDCYRELLASGLGTGTSGNVSCRHEAGMLITPTGISPDTMKPEELVAMTLSGEVSGGQLRPSSEWQMHAAIYQRRSDVMAVVHCHSRFATTLACTGRGIPAIHYMIAVSGKSEIPVAPYATFGTQALAMSAAEALADGQACLLANHGQIAVGTTAKSALRVATEVEELAAIYWHSLVVGNGQILSTQQMDEVMAAFGSYGQQVDP